MLFFDSHLHNKGKESGGFIIGTEGKLPPPPNFKILTNTEVLALQDVSKNYYSFYYVQISELNKIIQHPYLKYHPRRENYKIQEVNDHIKICQPSAVIVDTLNEPYWKPQDYWKLAAENAQIPFVFAHAGGYAINEFLKICNFQKNVWIDFSFTHTFFKCYGENESSGLPYVKQAIYYALHSSFKNRILFGTDYPFIDQSEVVKFYEKYLDLLNENFLNLVEVIKCQN